MKNFQNFLLSKQMFCRISNSKENGQTNKPIIIQKYLTISWYFLKLLILFIHLLTLTNKIDVQFENQANVLSKSWNNWEKRKEFQFFLQYIPPQAKVLSSVSYPLKKPNFRALFRFWTQ